MMIKNSKYETTGDTDFDPLVQWLKEEEDEFDPLDIWDYDEQDKWSDDDDE